MEPNAADVEVVESEFLALLACETPDDLHRVLVLRHPERRTADTMLPMALLGQSHAADPSATVVTSMLLLTDVRWRLAARDLARLIAESGLLTTDEVTLLAEVFVNANPGGVYWQVPDGWFDGPAIVIDLGLAPEDEGVAEPEEEAPAGPTVARRDVWPPLRRWAAAWLVRREPASWPQMLNRAKEVGGKPGASLVHGLLDAGDVLPERPRWLVLRAAAKWPDHTVRKRSTSPAGGERPAAREGTARPGRANSPLPKTPARGASSAVLIRSVADRKPSVRVDPTAARSSGWFPVSASVQQ